MTLVVCSFELMRLGDQRLLLAVRAPQDHEVRQVVESRHDPRDDLEGVEVDRAVCALPEDVSQTRPDVDVARGRVCSNDACGQVDLGREDADRLLALPESRGEVDELLVVSADPLIVHCVRCAY